MSQISNETYQIIGHLYVELRSAVTQLDQLNKELANQQLKYANMEKLYNDLATGVKVENGSGD